MSYYSPKVYNKQNLKEEDRRELEYWNEQFLNLIASASFDAQISCNGTLGKIQQEIINEFCESLKEQLGYMMQEDVVSIIDGYGEDYEVNEIEDYDTFYYEAEEDETNE